MAIRIVDTGRKAATIVAMLLAISLLGLTMALAVDESVGVAATAVLMVAAVALCGRTFRGPSEEPAPPRSWWRLTERPTAGFILGALFAARAISYLTVENRDSSVLLSSACAVTALLAAAFVHSSVRLTMRR